MQLSKLAVLALAGISVFAPAALAQTKDSATLCMTLEPPILDPTQGAAQAIKEVTYGNIFEGLVALDRNSKLVPALAESWTVSDDGLVYNIGVFPYGTARAGLFMRRVCLPNGWWVFAAASGDWIPPGDLGENT